MSSSCYRSYHPTNRECYRAPRRLFFLSLTALLSFTSLTFLQHSPSPAHKEIFSDVTEQARIVWRHFSGESPDRFLIETMGGGVAFLDFDGDGYEDLFFVTGGETPHGKSSSPIRNALYRNLGNGEFEDVAAKAGVDRLAFYGMGAAVGDFDNDGFPDLYVTGFPSSALFHNNGDGSFADITDRAGVKNAERWAASAAWFDFDRDGYLDLVVTNFNDEYSSLFVSGPSLVFDDRTIASRLAEYTKPYVGWGIHFIDYDNDGNLDLLIANGHINQVIEATRLDVKYMELPLLLRNNGKGVFQDMREQVGAVFQSGYRARGLAVGDFDNDGGVDAVFTRLDGKPVLLHNNVGQNHSWVGFELQGTKSNRDAIGAKITVEIGSRKLVRWITGGASYLSSHDKRVVVGTRDDSSTLINAEIRWPSGTLQRLARLERNRYHEIVEPSAN